MALTGVELSERIARRTITLREVRKVRDLDRRTWLRAVPIAAVAAAAIAIPADLVDNPIFGRPIAPKPIDYVILAVTASLIGLILAIRPDRSDETERQETTTALGGFVSFLAVGCPVCNQAVVALLGTSGALGWWAPVQPVVGLAAVVLLLYTLGLRLRTHQLTACPLPDPHQTGKSARSGTTDRPRPS